MNLKGSPFTPGGDLRYSHGRWRVLDSVTSTVMSAVRTRGGGGGGVTGDLEGIDCRVEEGTSGNNSAAPVTRGRLMANLIEMASRGARTLVDNLDQKKVLSSDCTICFTTLNRDIDAYVKEAASVGSGGLSGIGNPSMPATKSRRESRFKDGTEGHASKKARVGPAE